MSGERIRIETPVGPVVGCVDQEAVHFGGVPYAQAERFGLPLPTSWTEVLDASGPGPAAPQLVAGLDLLPGMVPHRTAEDCLTLEIWTPGLEPDGGPVPVLVWVPGGSFLVGGAGLATYDGARLASEGKLVVVGVNYRLGALGFLAVEGVPPNLGLRDIAAAVQWLRENIAVFGGDPSHITVMGESAGAGALAHLLTGTQMNQPGQGVQAAILQSGSPTMTLTADGAGTVAAAVMADVSMDQLRTMPVDQVLQLQDAARLQLLATVGMMPFHPWVDGEMVVQPPVQAAQSGTLGTEVLVVGTTVDEMSLFRKQIPDLPAEIAHKLLGRKAAVMGLDRSIGAEVFDAAGGDLCAAIAEIDLHLPARLMAEGHAANNKPAYQYRFGWQAPGLGACHGLDLPFTFGTLDHHDWRTFVGADPISHGPAAAEAADALSARMRTAWTAVAHGTPPWPTHPALENLS